MPRSRLREAGNKRRPSSRQSVLEIRGRAGGSPLLYGVRGIIERKKGADAMTIQEMIREARTLSVDERKQLIKALVDIVNEPSPKEPKKRNLLELAGLGAEIWEGIDPQEYINQLRSEWDHRP
jgi:hypothetical protein